MHELPGQGHYDALAELLAPPPGLPKAVDAAATAAFRTRVCEQLQVPFPKAQPQVLERDGAGVREGVRIIPLSWQLPYGPPTHARLLMPAEGTGPWPGIVLCHDHGGSRWFGHERVSDGIDGPPPLLSELGPLRPSYEGRPLANDLAAAGFCVLVHDVFTWGSRRFAPSQLGESALFAGSLPADDDPNPDPDAVQRYHEAANQREHTIAKWCTVSGTCFSGILAYEDQVALDILLARPECAGPQAAVIGHSGGAARAACLAALDERLAATVCSCLVTTYSALIRHRSWVHTWQLWLPNLGPDGDWSDVVACAAPNPLFVHFGLQDGGFSPQGQRQANERIAHYYAGQHAQDAYRGVLNEAVPHRFPVSLREEVCAWLRTKIP